MGLPYGSVDELRAAYRFSNLQDFLDVYYATASVLIEAEDFRDLTAAYLARAHAENVRHAEIFFDPQTHTDRGVPFEAVIEGISAARADARRDLGITSHLILCFLRHLDEEAALDTFAAAMPWRDRIVGVGLDSGERGNPPRKFAEAFRRAREAGFVPVAHAGEEGPAEYVREALELLEVVRIDHGNRALDDPGLVAELARRRIPLTVCPLSNLRLCVVGDMASHPLTPDDGERSRRHRELGRSRILRRIRQRLLRCRRGSAGPEPCGTGRTGAEFVRGVVARRCREERSVGRA